MEAKHSEIPNFLSASNPIALRRAMLKNNAKLGLWVRYFDIQYVNGKWYVWYFADVKSDDELIKAPENTNKR